MIRGVGVQPDSGLTGDGLVKPLRRGDRRDSHPEMIDVAAAPKRAVANGLGAVSIGIDEERAVVVGAVFGARAGRPVVPVPRRRARLPEAVDVRPGRRGERDVQAPGHRLPGRGRRQREVVPLDQLLAGVGLLDLDRAQHRLVELPGRSKVGRPDPDMVEHRHTLAGWWPRRTRAEPPDDPKPAGDDPMPSRPAHSRRWLCSWPSTHQRREC
jgi:hypothetical protein